MAIERSNRFGEIAFHTGTADTKATMEEHEVLLKKKQKTQSQLWNDLPEVAEERLAVVGAIIFADWHRKRRWPKITSFWPAFLPPSLARWVIQFMKKKFNCADFPVYVDSVNIIGGLHLQNGVDWIWRDRRARSQKCKRWNCEKLSKLNWDQSICEIFQSLISGMGWEKKCDGRQ